MVCSVCVVYIFPRVSRFFFPKNVGTSLFHLWKATMTTMTAAAPALLLYSKRCYCSLSICNLPIYLLSPYLDIQKLKHSLLLLYIDFSIYLPRVSLLLLLIVVQKSLLRPPTSPVFFVFVQWRVNAKL